MNLYIGIQGTYQHTNVLNYKYLLPLSEDNVEEKADETKYDPG